MTIVLYTIGLMHCQVRRCECGGQLCAVEAPAAVDTLLISLFWVNHTQVQASGT